jgi:hypothetical protein
VCAECEFGAFSLDGAFNGRLDHVVVVVQPREVNCEPSILLYLRVMGHEDRPGLESPETVRVAVSVMTVPRY